MLIFLRAKTHLSIRKIIYIYVYIEMGVVNVKIGVQTKFLYIMCRAFHRQVPTEKVT